MVRSQHETPYALCIISYRQNSAIFVAVGGVVHAATDQECSTRRRQKRFHEGGRPCGRRVGGRGMRCFESSHNIDYQNPTKRIFWLGARQPKWERRERLF